jgi:hypothetical protein
MNLEAIASGAFKGTGRTIPPSLVSIVSNTLQPVDMRVVSGFGEAQFPVALIKPHRTADYRPKRRIVSR